MMERSLGTRLMQTFRKLPKARPKTRNAMARIGLKPY